MHAGPDEIRSTRFTVNRHDWSEDWFRAGRNGGRSFRGEPRSKHTELKPRSDQMEGALKILAFVISSL